MSIDNPGSDDVFRPFSREAMDAAAIYKEQVAAAHSSESGDTTVSDGPDGRKDSMLFILAAEADAKRGGVRRSYPEHSRRSRAGFEIGPVGITVGVIAAGLTISLVGGAIADSSYGTDRAKEYLAQQGYTDIDATSKNLLFANLTGCGSDDTVQYEFSAIAPSGDSVDVMVCKSLLKAATIRQG